VTLRQASDRLYHSPLLEEQSWLDHAFGTARATPAPGFLTLRQVHSARVMPASEWAPEVEADGLVTNRPALALAVKTADCVPILLADPVQHAVAAIHAGWRGTLAGIAAAGVAALEAHFGSQPRNVLAAFGPSIGPCCFEVGPDVSVLFRDTFPDWHIPVGRTRLDLREANRLFLTRAGVPESQIATHAPCTCCGGEEFYSWRRDRHKGQRMFAVIAIRE
jgi:polyphenol oxidase